MWVNNYVWLIPLLPMAAAGWIGLGWLFGLNRGEAGERQTARAAVWSTLASLLLALGVAIDALAHGAPGQLIFGDWIASGDYRVRLSFDFDPFSTALTPLVALLSLITLRFSVDYMHREAGFQRFYMILSLFSGGMLLIVTAGNAVLAFVGWELAGLSSFLLIGYAYDRDTATTNANRAFVTNRIGDAGFILAIFLAYHWLGGIEWPTIAAGAEGMGTLPAGLVASGFLIAALAKSAQVPFTPWITRALEGPTPSSAIFYGSLMVHAGVYLLIRLEPLFAAVPAIGIALLAFGLLSALYGVIGGLVQSDVKSALIFSVVAQVGLMFIECGLGWYELAAWHLALHAAWRAWHFLSSPGWMHRMGGPSRPVPAWLAGRRRLHAAAIQRFWLDPLADWLLVRPTQSLARDTQRFDEEVVNRLVGLPDTAEAASSLAEWQARRQGEATPEGTIGRGRGLIGKSMEGLANGLHWIEEQLVLKGSGEGLIHAIRHLGFYLQGVEQLLSRPRYLLLLIMATFVVII